MTPPIPRGLISTAVQYIKSPIYILSPVMDRSQISDLSREACHPASKQMWIHPGHKCSVYFPRGDRLSSSPCILLLIDTAGRMEADMQQREKEAETSNRLLDVRGHLVPEAKVIYIYLSPLSVSCLPFLSLWRVLLIHFLCTLACL